MRIEVGKRINERLRKLPLSDFNALGVCLPLRIGYVVT